MENRANIPDSDIAEERYSGPTRAVVAAGTGVFEHLKWAGLGLAAAASFALILPGQARSILEESRNFATRLKANASSDIGAIVKRSTGKVIHSLIGDKNAFEKLEEIANLTPEHREWLEHAVMNREHGFGHWFTTHTLGAVPKLGKLYKNTLLELSQQAEGSRGAYWTNALTFGGALAALGYAGGWVWALVHGGRHGNDGKYQLQRAQQEIRDTRELNTLLEQENIGLKTTLAAQQGTLHVARDETPSVTPQSTPALLDQAEIAPPAATGAASPHERHVRQTPDSLAASRDPIRHPPENQDWAESVKAKRDETLSEPARA